MAQVFTVLGPIPPESMGITAIHEHLLFGLPGWEHAPEEPLHRPSAFEKIKADLLEFKSLGGQTLVDCTGISMGRDVEFYQALSRVTGVNIVACTGFWSQRGIPGHFVSTSYSTKDADYVTRIFINELSTGMIAGLMRQSTVRAGFIVVANSDNRITETEEKLYKAAASAAKLTGCAVLTHGANMARRQLDILEGEGLAPNRIIIGDCDNFPDIERDKEIAKRGVYVGYNHAAYDDSPAQDRRRVGLIKAMVDAGLKKQVVISCGTIGHAIGYPRSRHPFGYLLSDFLVRLRQAGLGEGVIRTILEENPQRVIPY